MRTLLALGLLLLATAALAQAPVKVAYMYCQWPAGQASFKDEFDPAFKALGWEATKFENKQAQELSNRLGEFDVVVGGGVSNYEPPQDFKPFAAQWQAFLNRGGVVIATDASYDGINSQWIGGIDPALTTHSTICSAHSNPTAETLAATFTPGDPLLMTPQRLDTELATKTNWAHITDAGEGWTKAALCFDKQPFLIYRPYGKGLVLVTSYFRFAGATGPAVALLQNALHYVRLQQQGLRLTKVGLPSHFALGLNRLEFTLGNTGAADAAVTLKLEGRMGDRAAIVAEMTKTIPAGQEAVMPLALKLPERGSYETTLTIARDGQTLVTLHPAMSVPQLLAAKLRSRHAFADRPRLPVALTLAPELQERLAGLELTVQAVGAESGQSASVRPSTLTPTATASLAKLSPGKYDLLATLWEGDNKLAEARTPFVLNPRPTVYFNDKNVCFVDGKPFFLLAMYHVAWGATREQMLKCLDDVAAMGFNGVHTSCTNLDNYQAVLDRAQALGLKVIPEGIGAGSEALKRFKSHPAILAWNSGDEPDGSGTPPETVGANIDAVRDTDAAHPLYTTLCIPGAMAKYAPYLDVFSTDPYPLAGGNKNSIQVAKQTAQARDLVQRSRPLWIVPQCFGYPEGPWQIPTPAQERSMSYQALIEGANGLNWYVYDDVKFKLMDHPDLVAMMKQLTSEIKALTPFLLDPAYDAPRFQAGPEGCIRACAIKDGDTLLIMAAHTNEKDLGAQELTVPGLPNGAKAEVLFENRSVDTAGGKITDAFAPYAVHVYRLRL